MKTKLSVALLAVCSSLAAADATPSKKFYAGGSGEAGGTTMEYEVQAGETLFQISERFLGTPYRAEELAKANGISDPLRVKEGTRIKVPMPKAAVRYGIQRIDASGEYIDHNPDSPIPAADRFRIRVTTSVSGYLYAFNRSKDGTVKRIFPAGRRPAKVRAFSDYVLPAANYFRLDRARGDEEIWLVLAAQPVSDLEALVEGGVIESARMQEISGASTEKGIVIAGGDEDDEPGEVVQGDRPGKYLLVHPIRIKRR
jgi:hypothetical protein